MKEQDVKKEILEEIIALMEEKEAEGLKSHPKIAKVKIQSNDPEMAEEIKEKMMPEVMESEDESESDEEMEEPADDETKQKLIKMYSDLK